MKHIEDDSIATLPTTKLYGKGGPMTDELRELLAAWYVSRVDEGMGYVSDIGYSAIRTLDTLTAMYELTKVLCGATGPRRSPDSRHAVDEYEYRRGLYLPS